MPWFNTATRAVSGFACRRRARLSGQRLFPSVVEPRPSVMESPSVTTAAVEFSARTSTPDRIYQCCVAAAEDRFVAETALPVCRYDVAREPGCPVTSEEVSAK